MALGLALGSSVRGDRHVAMEPVKALDVTIILQEDTEIVPDILEELAVGVHGKDSLLLPIRYRSLAQGLREIRGAYICPSGKPALYSSASAA